MSAASDRPRWTRPSLRVFGRDVHAFRALGGAGFAAGGAAALGLARLLDARLVTVGALFGLAVVSYLALAALAAVVAGEPVLVFYHHAIAVVLVSTVALVWSGEAVLVYLDIEAVALSAFLAVGRLGCLTVGCCHGRPYEPRTPLGAVVYGDAHAEEGFPRHLVGVPLYPVQAVEAIGVALLVIGSVLWVALGEPRPGDLLGCVTVGYAVLRYRLEGLRGDPGRTERRGLSTARLTSVVIAIVIVACAAIGLVPWHWAYPLAAGLLVVAAARRAMKAPRPWDLDVLLHPDHVAELAALLALADEHTTAEHIVVAETSAGLRLSTTTSEGPNAPTGGAAVTLSSGRSEPLSELAAFAVGRLLTTLRQPEGGATLHRGSPGMFHVVLVDIV